jgi:hypothetical protein
VGFVPAKRRGTGEFLCFLFRLSLFRACACWGAVSFRVFEVWVWDIARVAMLQGAGGRSSSVHRPSRVERVRRVERSRRLERGSVGEASSLWCFAVLAGLQPFLMVFESGVCAARGRGCRGRGDGGIFVLSLSRRQHGSPRLTCLSDPFFLDLDLLPLPCEAWCRARGPTWSFACEIHLGDAEVVNIMRGPYAATAPPPAPGATFYLFYAYIPPHREKVRLQPGLVDPTRKKLLRALCPRFSLKTTCPVQQVGENSAPHAQARTISL